MWSFQDQYLKKKKEEEMGLKSFFFELFKQKKVYFLRLTDERVLKRNWLKR
jgi:hypothetical protein